VRHFLELEERVDHFEACLILGVDLKVTVSNGRIVLPAASSTIKLRFIYRLLYYYSNYFRSNDDMYS
jgi:hypothetical protein